MRAAWLPPHSNFLAAGAKCANFCVATSLLWTELHNYKGAWNRLWPWTWIIWRWLPSRLEVCGFGEDVMRLRIEHHRASAELRWHVANDRIFVWRIFVDHAHETLADRGKNQPRARIEAVTVRIAPNRRRRHYLVRILVEHRDHLVARREQAMVLGVRGQSRWPVAWCQGPCPLHRQRLRIELHNGALIFQVNVHVAPTIQRGLFRPPAQTYCADYFVGGGVDHAGVIAPAIHREHPLSCGILNNPVRIVASGLDFGNRLQRFQIKDGHRACAAVAGIALVQVRRDSRTMDALGIRYVADYFPAGLINDH